MYEYGRGVPKEYGEALRWYRKAAENGMAPAQDRIPVEAVGTDTDVGMIAT